MKPETTEWLEGIAADFTAQSNPAQAPAMAAYMKHHFPFLGIKKPERAALAKPWLAKGNRPDVSDLPELCAVLWQKPEREWAYLALELTRLELKSLQFSDLPWLMELVRSRSWWDTVDLLASDRIGRTLLRYPDQRASLSQPTGGTTGRPSLPSSAGRNRPTWNCWRQPSSRIFRPRGFSTEKPSVGPSGNTEKPIPNGWPISLKNTVRK